MAQNSGISPAVGVSGYGLWKEGVVRGRPEVSMEEVVVWPKLGQASCWDEASEIE